MVDRKVLVSKCMKVNLYIQISPKVETWKLVLFVGDAGGRR